MGRDKATRTRLPWHPSNSGEFIANGGGTRQYRIEDYGKDFMMKGSVGDVQFRSGPYKDQDQAVEAAEELEFLFADRIKAQYTRRSERT